MSRMTPALLVAPALFALSACVREAPPRETQVIVQPPPQQMQPVVAMAPGPPPPPHSDRKSVV